MSTSKTIGLFLGLAVLVFALFTEPPAGMTREAWLTAGVALLMACW